MNCFRSLVSTGNNMYDTLPKSLKAEVMVRSCTDDPEITRERRTLTQSKSVSELATIHGLGDLPIPANIERLWNGKVGSVKEESKQETARYNCKNP